MDNELEVIRHQMEETRSSLADKLETLEHQLGATVTEATEAVEHTVEAVENTVEAVKETLDPRLQVERHPWLMMAGAVATGYLSGCLLSSSEPAARPSRPPMEPWGAPHQAAPPPPAPAATAATPAKESPLASSVEQLKGLAIGSLMSVVRELVTRVAPAALAPELVRVVDELTTSLGGKPLRNTPASTAPERESEEEPSPEPATATAATSSAPVPSGPRPKSNGRGKRRTARA